MVTDKNQCYYRHAVIADVQWPVKMCLNLLQDNFKFARLSLYYRTLLERDLLAEFKLELLC